MDEIGQKISEKVNDCTFSLDSIQQFLLVMSNQKKEYSDFSYQANGSSTLLLKGKKNGTEDVALQVIQCKCYESEINAIKSRNAILKQLAQQSDYFVKVNDTFLLKQSNGASDQGQTINEVKDFVNIDYFVIEIEQCQGSLSDILEEFRLGKNNPTENFKMSIVVQILDAVNLLHQRQIPLQQDLDIQKFLVSSSSNDSQIVLKLLNLNMIPRKDLKNNKYPQEAIEQDKFQLGLVFLQLDNFPLFDPTKITDSELTELQEGKIFENYQLNRESLLYKIACKFLIKSKVERITPYSMLMLALKKSKELQTIPLFSVVLKSNIDQISMNIIRIQKTNQQNNSRIVKNRENKLKKLLSQLEASTQQQVKQLTKESLKFALKTILEWKDFAWQYDLLGVGKSGVFLGVENIKGNRQSVLRLSLCLDKSDTLKEIGIMRICQSPYIVKFYGQRFFKDTQGNEFVVYELERCKYSLSHYLEFQRIKGQLNEEQKHLLMLQILDSVGLLHESKILHRNISLGSFMITENQQGQAIAKLSNFSHASSYQECCIEKVELESSFFDRQQLYSPYNCLIQKFKGESVLYFAPERLNNISLTTYQTDRFAVGLCLALLDNYLVLNEDHLAEKLVSIKLPYKNIFKKMHILIDSSSHSYHIAIQLLGYNPQQRKPIEDLIHNSKQQYLQNNFDLAAYSNSLEKYPKRNRDQHNMDISATEFLESLETASPVSFPLRLSYLSLDFPANSIEDDQANSLLLSLTQLTNLTSLVLNLNNNQISDLGAQYLLPPLANLINLSSLSLNLSFNLIGQIGASSLLYSLTNLINLSKLIFDLRNNQIGALGAQQLLSPLANLMNLSSLSVNLNNNLIRDDGAKYLLLPIRNLLNITSFSCYLANNEIRETGAQFLLQPLNNLINLSNLSLNFDSNSIRDNGAKNLFVPVANLMRLSSMSFRLSYNLLNEFEAKHLFVPLANLNYLSTLIINLRDNNLNDVATSSLLTPLANLPNITSLYLNLAWNYVGELGGSSLLSPLSKFNYLQCLSVNLRINAIKDIGAKYFLSSLSKLNSLSSLEFDLSCNKIGSVGAESLLFPLRNLINLKTLSFDLQNNLIEGSPLKKSFLSPLADLSNLSTFSLVLDMNPLEDAGASSLLVPLANLISLTKIQISLNCTSFGTSSTQSLLSPLGKLTGLSDLSLNVSNNKIGDIGAQILLSPLANLSKLSNFQLGILNSQIGILGAQTLLIPLASLQNLSTLSLDISHNSLGDIGAQKIMVFLSNLPKLQTISCDLQNTNIKDIGAQSILLPVLNFGKVLSISLNLKQNDSLYKKTEHLYRQYLKQIKEITFLE